MHLTLGHDRKAQFIFAEGLLKQDQFKDHVPSRERDLRISEDSRAQLAKQCVAYINGKLGCAGINVSMDGTPEELAKRIKYKEDEHLLTTLVALMYADGTTKNARLSLCLMGHTFE